MRPLIMLTFQVTLKQNISYRLLFALGGSEADPDRTSDIVSFSRYKDTYY